MNNKVIAGIVAVIIIAAGAYLLMRNKSDNQLESNTASTNTEAEVNTDSTSLKELMSSGTSQKCTFSSDEQGAKTDGTFYVSGGKSRGDFTSVSSGTTTKSHMIYDGTTSYVWMDGQNTGFKMKVDAQASIEAQNQTVDPNKNYEYDCDSWSADSSVFNPPSNITFTEFTAPNMNVNAGASSNLDTKAIQQAVCAQMPEPAKTQCLAGIK